MGCVVDLGRDKRTMNEHSVSVPPTCSEERRQLEPQLASWSELAIAYATQMHALCASVTAVYLPFFVLCFWEIIKSNQENRGFSRFLPTSVQQKIR